MGRFDESIAEARRAADLDPLSIATMWTLARVLNLAGDQHGAIAEMKKALEIEPRYGLMLQRLGLAAGVSVPDGRPDLGPRR